MYSETGKYPQSQSDHESEKVIHLHLEKLFSTLNYPIDIYPTLSLEH